MGVHYTLVAPQPHVRHLIQGGYTDPQIILEKKKIFFFRTMAVWSYNLIDILAKKKGVAIDLYRHPRVTAALGKGVTPAFSRPLKI